MRSLFILLIGVNRGGIKLSGSPVACCALRWCKAGWSLRTDAEMTQKHKFLLQKASLLTFYSMERHNKQE